MNIINHENPGAKNRHPYRPIMASEITHYYSVLYIMPINDPNNQLFFLTAQVSYYLVGGFNLFEKYAREIGSSPQGSG